MAIWASQQTLAAAPGAECSATGVSTDGVGQCADPDSRTQRDVPPRDAAAAQVPNKPDTTPGVAAAFVIKEKEFAVHAA